MPSVTDVAEKIIDVGVSTLEGMDVLFAIKMSLAFGLSPFKIEILKKKKTIPKEILRSDYSQQSLSQCFMQQT